MKNVYYFDYMLGEYNNKFATVQLSSKETYQVFDLVLSEGGWLYNCKQTSQYPNAVLCGYAYRDVKIGDDIEITINDQKFKVHTVVKVQSPYFAIFLGDSSSRPDGIHLCQSTHMNERVFLPDDDFTRNAIQAPILTGENFFVSFKDNATQEEKKKYFLIIFHNAVVKLCPHILTAMQLLRTPYRKFNGIYLLLSVVPFSI